MLEYSLCKPIRNKFSSLVENIILGSLKSFFQLDHQVDISFYLTKAAALCHSRELASCECKIPFVKDIDVHIFLYISSSYMKCRFNA